MIIVILMLMIIHIILSNLKLKKRGLNLDEIDDYEIWKNNLQLKVKILLKIIHKIRFILNFS